jgi:alanyl-tRNA synthetase
MTAQEIRSAYLRFFNERGHTTIPRALLVPQNDPSTLFTGSGMQPLIPYLLGQEHGGGKRLVDSQTCLRAQDIEEVGDNRHTTFFEMLGNWSLGDYFKQEQINWFWEFITNEIKLDPKRIFISCYVGNKKAGIPKDTESAEIWKDIFNKVGIEAKEVELWDEEKGGQLGEQGGRIFYYSDKNWWCRAGNATNMPDGEPGGPDSEMFYLYPEVQHDKSFGEHCHPNCDCGRYIELGNSVFMEYQKTADGFVKLPKRNVDYGGGLERIAAAAINSPDVFKISLLWPMIEKLESLSGKDYDSNQSSMRVIADHLRGAVFLAVDGVVPSNKEQGYVMRRLIRRAIRQAFELGIEDNFLHEIAEVICDLYKDDFPELKKSIEIILNTLSKEEKVFRQTLRQGVREFNRMTENIKQVTGEMIFKLHDTYGFPAELTVEEAYISGIKVDDNWKQDFDKQMDAQRERSQTASKGTFKGGLADHSEIVTKYHTATHLMYRALRQVLGDHVMQRGSNITAERLRFDFSHPDKMTAEQIAEVENIVNEQIKKDWPVSWREENTKQALANGVMGAFGDKYGERVKVYTVGDPEGEHYSREICGGPHVEHTGALGEGSKKFKITKEESSSAGIRRIKAILV